MSQEHVAGVQRWIDAFNEGGGEAMARLIPDDLVIHAFDDWVEQSVYYGPAGALQLVGVFMTGVSRLTLEVHDVIDAGDKVVAELVYVGELPDGGVIRTQLGAVNSDLRDDGFGHCTHWYKTWAEARRAGGLD